MIEPINALRSCGLYGPLLAALALAAEAGAEPVNADHQSAPLLTEMELGEEIPTIKSVSFLTQARAQAPASVTILDRRFIESAPASSLTDLFRLVPGFQSYFVNAGEPRVNYHALADSYPRRMEVKVDGRSVYESIFTTVIWASLGLQLQDIDRIEIVRGSNAPVEGSNAFIGSVNIITRSPLNSGGTRVTLSRGSDAIGAVSASQTGQLGRWSYRAAANYQRQDGFDDAPGTAMDDSAEGHNLNWRGIWTPNMHNILDIHVGFSEDRVGVGGDEDFATHRYRGQFQKLQWSHYTASGDEVTAQFYHNRLQTTADESQRLFSSLLLAEGVPEAYLPVILADYPDRLLTVGFNDTQADRWELELQRSFRWGAQWRGVTGAAWRLDSAKSELLFGRSDTLRRETQRLFGSVEWQPQSDLTLNSAATVEHASGRGNYRSLRLGGNYQPNPQSVWRLSASQGERMGSLLETDQFVALRYDDDIILDATIIAGDELETEKLSAYEIGYNHAWIDRRLNFDGRWFYEKYQDMISSRREFFTDEQRQPAVIFAGVDDQRRRVGVRRNATNILMKGYELELSYRPNPRWLVNVSWTDFDVSGYAHKYQWPDDYFALQYYRVPRASRSALVSYSAEQGWQLSASLYYQGRAKWQDGNDTEPYLRADVELSQRWQLPGGRELKLALLAQNLGENYTEFYTTNQFGSRYIVSLQWFSL